MHYWIFVLYKVLELSYTEKQDNYIKKKTFHRMKQNKKNTQRMQRIGKPLQMHETSMGVFIRLLNESRTRKGGARSWNRKERVLMWSVWYGWAI